MAAAIGHKELSRTKGTPFKNFTGNSPWLSRPGYTRLYEAEECSLTDAAHLNVVLVIDVGHEGSTTSESKRIKSC